MPKDAMSCGSSPQCGLSASWTVLSLCHVSLESDSCPPQPWGACPVSPIVRGLSTGAAVRCSRKASCSNHRAVLLVKNGVVADGLISLVCCVLSLHAHCSARGPAQYCVFRLRNKVGQHLLACSKLIVWLTSKAVGIALVDGSKSHW